MKNFFVQNRPLLIVYIFVLVASILIMLNRESTAVDLICRSNFLIEITCVSLVVIPYIVGYFSGTGLFGGILTSIIWSYFVAKLFVGIYILIRALVRKFTKHIGS